MFTLKEHHTKLFLFTLSFVLCVLFVSCSTAHTSSQADQKVKVGILHSLSGTMAVSESPVVDATILAINEINEQGGVLGQMIEPIIVDAKSDPLYAAEVAEQLIVDEEISVLFGCWTSSCRRSVVPIVEKYNALLFYPIQYEGLEDTPNVIYTGSTPNQQIIPAIQWANFYLGSRFFLVGSDYIFPHAANEIIKDHVKELGAEVVGEEYVLLGGTDFQEVVERIIETQPDIILNTVNGDSNNAFFTALRTAGITPEVIPTISFSIAEVELENMSANLAGDYAVWSYFQSIDNSTNNQFIENFRAEFGEDRVIDDPMEAAYIGVKLWANVVNKAGSLEFSDVLDSLSDQRFLAPQGWVQLDAQNRHLWKIVRIGKILDNKQFEIVWESNVDVRPQPFPPSRERGEWLVFVKDKFEHWNNNWANPGN